jgi:hypothetical protein
MREFGREIISNTVYREEFFCNIDEAISGLKAIESYEAVVYYKYVKKIAREFIDTVEN